MDGKDETSIPAPLRTLGQRQEQELVTAKESEKGPAPQLTPKRTIFQRYEQQLLTARQLARFRARNRLQQGLDIEEPEPGLNRGQYMRQVVEELSLSLMISGNNFPVIEEIRRELTKQLQKEVEFYYPPGKKMRILIRDNGKLRPLDENEQQFVNRALDLITRQKVDETMLYKPYAAKPLSEFQGEK